MVPEGFPPPDVAGMAHALRLEAASAQLTRDLSSAGADVMVLKGPPVQRRLLGEPAAYRSDDLDVLVRGIRPTAARRHLADKGWTFHPGNGRLWRLDGAAAFLWRQAQIDVHWGLHVGLVPARRMRPLAERMWSGARRADSQRFEPDALTLATYLVLHSADRLAHPGKRRLLEAAIAATGDDWSGITDLARLASMESIPPVVRRLLATASTDPVDVLCLTYGRPRARAIEFLRRSLPQRLTG